MTTKEVVARFGGYALREDASLTSGVRSWNVTGATANFGMGPVKYGRKMSNAIMFGMMAGDTDNTECFVTVTWPDGASLTISDLASRSYAEGQYMAKAIRDLSGVQPQQQAPAQACWNSQTGRWELNGQYWNGFAWELS